MSYCITPTNPVREQDLSAMLGEPLKGLSLSQERKRLERNRRDLEAKLDLIYEDKLASTITPDFWKRKQEEFTAQLRWIGVELERLNQENGSDLATVNRIIELSQKAYSLYLSRNPFEQRELLDNLLSNSTLKDKTAKAKLAPRVGGEGNSIS